LRSIPSRIEDALRGNVEAIEALRATRPQELSDAVRGKQLILTRDAVVSVLTEFRDGKISAVAAQQWASFVSHGQVDGAPQVGPIEPVEIDWELPYEDAIAEALARLDELGDLIDGELEDGEADQLIADLT
jgi:hypothetical protein